MADKGTGAPKNLLQTRLLENAGAIQAARTGFNQTNDPNLLEYYLYEVNALQARHAYLFRQLREQWRQEESP